jgi:hypothetical protein
VPEETFRVNVTLGAEYAEKLTRLAERTHVREGTLASSLLSQAIDDADIEARRIVELLDGIPGAWERIEQGIEDAQSGRTIPLEQL